MHSQQHNSCQFLAEKCIKNKHMCTKEFQVNRRLTHSEEVSSLKALSNSTLPPILWFLSDFQLIIMHQHCLTGIPKFDTFDESAYGMSTDNKRQLILFDVTGLPIENVPTGQLL